MADENGPEMDVKEFSFRQMCKLRVGNTLPNIKDRLNHIAISKNFGLIFAVSNNTDIKVISIQTIEKISVSDNSVNDEVDDFPCNVLSLGVNITHISMNADESYIAIVYRGGDGGNSLCFGYIDVKILAEQSKQGAIFATTTLLNCADIFVKDLCCHPETPTLTALNLSNGHVLMLQVTDGNQINVVSSLAQGSPVYSVCWSPKGKQIVVGCEDGRIIQYDKTLKIEKRNIPGPPAEVFDGQVKSVGGLHWISSFLFLAIYNSSDVAEIPSAVMVDAKKDGPPTYTVLEDIYYGYCEERTLCYYFAYVSAWEIMVSMGSNALEAVPLGKVKERWQRWALQDTGRAEVPLNANEDETYPVGNGICLNSTLTIKQDDRELPAAPVYVMLSTDGVLCAYQMVNQFPNVNHKILLPTSQLPLGTAKRGQPIQATSQVVSAIKPTSSASFEAPLKAAPIHAVSTAPFALGLMQSGQQSNLFGKTADQKPTGGGINFGGSSSFEAAAPKAPALWTGQSGFNFGDTPSSITTSTTTSANIFGGATSANSTFSFGTTPSSQQTTAKLSSKTLFASSTIPAVTATSSATPFSFSALSSTSVSIPNPNTISTFNFSAQNEVMKQPASGGGTPNLFQTASSSVQTSNTTINNNGTCAPPPPYNPPFVAATSQPNSGGTSFKNPGNGFSFSKSNTPAPQVQPPVQQTVESTSLPRNFVASQSTDPPKPVLASLPQYTPATRPTVSGFQSISDKAGLVNPPTAMAPYNASPLTKTPVVKANSNIESFQPPAKASAVVMQPQQTDVTYQNEEQDIENYTAKLDNALQEHIREEINSFNTEMDAFRKTFLSLSNRTDLIGSHDELLSLSNGIEDVKQTIVGDYRVIMSENNSECQELRDNVLTNFKNLDQAILLKEKLEDQRYSSVLKTRPLDPISARQRKELRGKVNHLENLLTEINVSLDTKWEEKEAQKRRGRTRATAAASQNQQIYKTVEAIEQITNNLSNRLNILASQSEESQLINMNMSRTSNNTGSKTFSNRSNGQGNTTFRKTNRGTPQKFQQLKSFLTHRGSTPVRKPKQYSHPTNFSFSEGNTTLPTPHHGNLNPKAASTPAFNDDVTFQRPTVPQQTMQLVPEEKEKSMLNAAAEKLKNEAMTSMQSRTPINIATPKAPENTPMTPILNKLKHLPNSVTPEKSQPVNKNLFGTCSLNNGFSPTAPSNGNQVQFQTPGNCFTLPSQSVTPAAGFWNTPSTRNASIFTTGTAPNETSNAHISETALNEIDNSHKSVSSSLYVTNVITTTTGFAGQSDVPEKKSTGFLDNIWGKKEIGAGEIEQDTGFSFGSNTTPSFNFTAGSSQVKPISGQKVSFGSSIIESSSNKPFTFNSINSGSAAPSFTLPSEDESGSASKAKAPNVSFGNLSSTEPDASRSNASGFPGFGSTSVKPATQSVGFSFGTSTAMPSLSATTPFASIHNASKVPQSLTFTSTTLSAIGSLATSSAPNSTFSMGKTSTSSLVKTSTIPVVDSSSAPFTSTLSTTTTSSSGMFGNASQEATTSSSSSDLFCSGNTTYGGQFGSQTSASGGLFGNTTTTTPSSGLFGNTKTSTSGLFGGTTTTTTSGGIFGSTTATTTSGGLFGSTVTTTTSGGIFSGTATSTASGGFFGSSITSTASGGLFGSSTTSTASGGLFCSTTTPPTSSGIFGSTTTASASGGLFVGTTTSNASGGLFDSGTITSASSGIFGSTTTASASGGLFGGTTTSNASGGLFDSGTITSASGGLFGSSTASTASGGLFCSTTTPTTSSGLFGSNTNTATSGGLFGTTTTAPASGGLFGGSTTSTASGGLFGSNTNTATSGGLFGTTTTAPASGGLFGGSTTSTASGGLFGNTTASSVSLFGAKSSSGDLFGSSTVTTTSGSLFGGGTPSSSSGMFGGGGTSGGFGSSGGGGFGLGGKPINDPNKNPFGSTPSADSSNSAATSSNLFGGPSQSSSFGQNTSDEGQLGTGSFSKGFGNGINTSSNTFGASGFGTPAQSSAAATFGGAPAFGSPPAFGAAPMFGSAPAFGSSPQAGNTFNAAPTFGSGATFGSGGSVFGSSDGGSTSGIPTFGSLANQSNVPTFGQLSGNSGNSTFGAASTFGSGGAPPSFGGAPPSFGNAPPSFGSDTVPSFGGANSAGGAGESPSGASFNSWR